MITKHKTIIEQLKESGCKTIFEMEKKQKLKAIMDELESLLKLPSYALDTVRINELVRERSLLGV